MSIALPSSQQKSQERPSYFQSATIIPQRTQRTQMQSLQRHQEKEEPIAPISLIQSESKIPHFSLRENVREKGGSVQEIALEMSFELIPYEPTDQQRGSRKVQHVPENIDEIPQKICERLEKQLQILEITEKMQQKDQQLQKQPQRLLKSAQEIQRSPQIPLNSSQSLQLHYSQFISSKQISQKISCLYAYCKLLPSFFTHFIECNALHWMLEVLVSTRYPSLLLQSFFMNLQILLQTIRPLPDIHYLILCVAKEDIVGHPYRYSEEEDQSFYTGFVRVLCELMSKREEYVDVFYNVRQPQFPLMLKLLSYHDCPNLMVHTSMRLTIMKMCRNSKLNTYISEYPFVMAYALYTLSMYAAFKYMVQGEASSDAWEESLEYMHEFMRDKSTKVVDMYSNAFIASVGKYVYQSLRYGNIGVKKRIIECLVKYVVSTKLLTDKIRRQIMEMMGESISKEYKMHLEKRIVEFDEKKCMESHGRGELKEHCRAVYNSSITNNSTNNTTTTTNSTTNNSTNNNNSTTNSTTNRTNPATNPPPYPPTNTTHSNRSLSSIFLHPKSYFFPETNEQLSALSSLIGYPIHLNNTISEQSLPSIPIYTAYQPNPLCQQLLSTGSQQVLFYYLLGLNHLPQGRDLPTDRILSLLLSSVSLSPIVQFYHLAHNHPLPMTAYLTLVYDTLLERLGQYIVIYGPLEERLRIDIKGKEYVQDIIREVQCDMVLFAAVRHIVGGEGREQIKQDGWERKLREYRVKTTLITNSNIQSHTQRSNIQSHAQGSNIQTHTQRSNIQTHGQRSNIQTHAQRSGIQSQQYTIECYLVSIGLALRIENNYEEKCTDWILLQRIEVVQEGKRLVLEVKNINNLDNKDYYEDEYTLQFMDAAQTSAVCEEIKRRKKHALDLTMSLWSATFEFQQQK